MPTSSSTGLRIRQKLRTIVKHEKERRPKGIMVQTFPVAQAGSFQYSALQNASSIRLLLLHPGRSEDDLAGELMVADLESHHVPYEAISYTWGLPVLTQQIMLGGNTLKITESLFQVLKALRYPDRKRVLWVDAISIDQTSIAERSHQVKLMCQIYSECTQCLAWLGPEADGSELVPSFIDDLEAFMVKDAWSSEPSWKKGPIFRSAEALYEGIPRDNDVRWLGYVKFLCRPWFRRLWILQEVVLPPAVQFVCGSWQIAADRLYMFHQLTRLYQFAGLIDQDIDDAATSDLTDSWELLDMHMRFRARKNRSVGLPDEYMKMIPQKLPIQFLLACSERCQVTDPKDRFYALLGLADDIQNEPELAPDYGKSLDEITRGYNTVFFRNGEGPELLSLVGADPDLQNINPSRPSWAPNWQIRQFENQSGNVGSAPIPTEVVEPDPVKSLSAVCLVSDSRITVRGRLICRLSQRTTRANDLSVEFYDEVISLKLASGTGMDPIYNMDRLVRTFTGDRTHKHVRPLPDDYVELCIRHMFTGLQVEDEYANDMALKLRRMEQLAYARLAMSHSSGACFGITDTQNYGMFPTCSQPGDWVFMIDGGAKTFLIRHHPEADVYTWLGRVFVYDLDKHIKDAISNGRLDTLTMV